MREGWMKAESWGGVGMTCIRVFESSESVGVGRQAEEALLYGGALEQAVRVRCE